MIFMILDAAGHEALVLLRTSFYVTVYQQTELKYQWAASYETNAM